MAALIFAHRYVVLVLAIAIILFAPVAEAGEVTSAMLGTSLPTTSELQFDQAKIAKVEGRLHGKGFHEYTFTARKGQRVALMLLSDVAPWIAINLLAPLFSSAPDMRPVVYSNFIDGTTSWQGVAPDSGTYTVRVALLHADAKRASQVSYELDVALK
ncbi:MAG TPA: hypothetical protein VGN07_23685 [Steroidobacteraceae bacterium]|jgi:hypothetical protein